MSDNLPFTRREFALGLTGMIAAARHRTFDVVVIGAGAFGAWIAYECRLRGWSVLLLDSYGPANSLASSGGESRILRVGYGPQISYSRWAIRSLTRWQQVLELAHAPQLFLRTGVLWVGPKQEPYLQSTIHTLRQLGVRFELLDSGLLQDRYPQLRVSANYVGILELDSGTILARQAVDVLVHLAITRGISYRKRFVLPPEVSGSLEYIRTSEGETVRASHFVFACGAWLPKVFPDVIGTLIQPTRQEVFFFAAPPGDETYGPTVLPSWVEFRADRIFYGCPDIERRGFKVAADKHGVIIDPDTENRVPSPEAMLVVRNFLSERFPGLAASPCIEARVCQYENTVSGDFLIDRHPRSTNVWLVGGGSGHGFKHGPAVAQYVVSLMKSGQHDSRFSLQAALKQEVRAIH